MNRVMQKMKKELKLYHLLILFFCLIILFGLIFNLINK